VKRTVKASGAFHAPYGELFVGPAEAPLSYVVLPLAAHASAKPQAANTGELAFPSCRVFSYHSIHQGEIIVYMVHTRIPGNTLSDHGRCYEAA
jgi:hypothetical protein